MLDLLTIDYQMVIEEDLYRKRQARVFEHKKSNGRSDAIIKLGSDVHMLVERRKVFVWVETAGLPWPPVIAAFCPALDKAVVRGVRH